MLSDITKEYYKEATLEHRKKLGQYMTPYDIIEASLKSIDIKKFKNILEPSCGTGQFIDKISHSNKRVKITGIEIDKKIFDIINVKFKDNKKVTIFNEDFLLFDFKDTKYDLIIGNPPYFEINKKNKIYKTYNEIITKYKEYLNGRTNIYSLYLKKSIELLEEEGILLFVIPTSLLSSKYFEGIRKNIVATCNIIKIEILNSDSFEDALQQTMIFGLQKLNHNEKSDNKYIIKLGNTIIFNQDYEKYNLELQNKKFIKDLKCTVKTGSVVWNQHKHKLTNEKKDNIVLIYPRNLNSDKNELELSSHDKKKQYIDSTKYTKHPISGPLIAINRIIGIKDITLNPVLIEKGEHYFENHVNIIYGELKNLKIIYESLKKKETVDFIKNIIGNTQLSKTELETMVPL